MIVVGFFSPASAKTNIVFSDDLSDLIIFNNLFVEVPGQSILGFIVQSWSNSTAGNNDVAILKSGR